MPLEIKLEQTKDMFCYESALASVAIWWNRRYEMIFSEAWNFDFHQSEKTEDSRIIINRGRIDMLYEEFHGISINKIVDPSPIKALEIIKYELNFRRPVYVILDSFYVPWLPDKEKVQHFPAHIIVVDIDCTKGINCLDIHHLKDTSFLPVSNFLASYKSYITFLLSGNEKHDINWCNVIASRFEQFSTNALGMSQFDKMRAFADLLESESINNMVLSIPSSSDFGDLPILNNIFKVGPSRAVFATALKYMANRSHCQELLDISHKLIEASNKWYNARSFLTKEFYANRLNKHLLSIIASKIREIADFEQNTSQILEKLCINESKIHSFDEQNNYTVSLVEEENEIVQLDIKPYLNNHGFSINEHNNTNADFTGIGEFLLTEVFPTDCILHNQISEFNFSSLVGLECNDNISCTAQVIHIESLCCKAVMFLGCSEWGSFNELFKLIYSDGTTEEISVGFTDWFSERTFYNETVAWKGTSVEKKEISIKYNSRFLFTHTYPLKKRSSLKCICLPNCPNMHLFAISVIIILCLFMMTTKKKNCPTRRFYIIRDI